MRRLPLPLLLPPLLLLLAGAAVPALAAGDRVAPGRAIGPITLFQERATIAALLGGDGVVIRRTPKRDAPGNRNLDRVEVAYPSLALVVRFPTDEASALAVTIATRSPRYRTGAGIGVGSARARLLRAHPRTTCVGSLCTLHRRHPGPLTRFRLAGGRVVRVSVSSR
jgi:hypothetical protein